MNMGANPGAFVLFTKARSKLGELILQRMAAKGLSRDDVASAMKVSRGTLNRYITGAVIRPPSDRMKILARVLGVSLEALLNTIPKDRRLPERQVHGRPVGKKGDDMTDETLKMDSEEELDKMDEGSEDEEEMKEEEETEKGSTEKACDEMPEVEKSIPESFQKQFNEMQKQLQAMVEEKETRIWVDKAAPMQIGKAEEVGGMLRRIATFDSDLAGKVFKLLSDADARIKQAGLFEERGTATGGEVADEKAIDKLNKKAAEIQGQEPQLTKQQAFAKAWDANPDLVAQHKSER